MESEPHFFKDLFTYLLWLYRLNGREFEQALGVGD